MNTYAAIAAGYVLQIINANSTPATPSGCDFVVDVTSADPMPDVGWHYNGSSFEMPTAVLVPCMPEVSRDLIGDVQGAVIFNTDAGSFQKNDGGGWVDF